MLFTYQIKARSGGWLVALYRAPNQASATAYAASLRGNLVAQREHALTCTAWAHGDTPCEEGKTL